ncbi:DNA-dependent kinase catalytic subunit-like [Brachionus plicatilis]|uniref:DNA-dependent kinase catalytic subunit-like n=1 Tax=Brachionus plicatilis TaxID=10195 RepID=A0A3M7SJI2_BRAPC|nr:DNA-dependent kinase catalytic subunit-like [Brachionus plicatilis]
MNDLEKHIQNLFDSLSNSNVDAAKSIVLDIVYLCGENLNPQTITFCLSLFFKREKNLLTFLRKTITRDEFRGCKVDLLQFLEKFITSAEKKILPYSPDIKDTCILLFSSDKYSDVRCATFSIISKILELTKGEYEITAKMNIPKLADDYFLSLANQSKLSSSIKANILSILGRICWYHPEVISSKSNKCLELFLTTLKNEINAKFRKSDLSLIAGALDGLNSYLNNFSVSETSDHLRAVFNFIKLSLLSSSEDLSRYAVPKSALNILIKHCRQFDELIYSDYKEIFDRISQWSEHKNYDMKKLAYLALDSYYKSLAEMIRVKSNTETDKCRLIFKYFIQKFYKNLTDGNKDLKEMVISIKGYGAFAGPCRELMDTKDMKLMLNIIIDICDRNFLSADSAQHNEIYDEKIFQLSSFIESLSCVCSQIDSFSEGSLNTMEKLVILAIDCYPKLVKRYNNQISLAIAALFLAIQRTNFSDEFISRIIYHSLIRIFSYKTLYSVNQEDTSDETNEPMSSIIVTTSLDYVMLWSNFLGLQEFSDLKSDNLDDKKKIVEIIFNEYIESIIKIMNKLDLAAVKNDGSEVNGGEQENVDKNQSDLGVSSDPIIGLKPQKPRDFEIFINLVDFTRELLMNKNFDLFEKWLFKLSKEIILLSTSHCLISGFYKLATLIMKMAPIFRV